MHLAEGTLYLFITSLLWAFDIEAPIDNEGKRVLPPSDVDEWISVLPWYVLLINRFMHLADRFIVSRLTLMHTSSRDMLM